MTEPAGPVAPTQPLPAQRPVPARHPQARPQHWLWAQPVRVDGLNDDAPPRPPLFRDTVRFNLLIRAVAFIGIFITVTMIGGVVLFLIGVDMRHAEQLLIPNAFLLISASLAAYLPVALWLEGRRPPIELSLRRAGGLLVGLGLGTVLISLVVVILLLLGAFKIDGTQTPQNLATIIMGAGFQAAIFEEILFRGFLFRYVEETLGTWLALVISALVFGLVHLGNPNATLSAALSIAVEAGILFAAVYIVTRSLWVCMGLHFAWNVVQALVWGVPVSGIPMKGWLNSHPAGPDWLSGGRFGAEASVVALVLLTALAVYLLWRAHRDGKIVAPIWVRRKRAKAGIAPAHTSPTPEPQAAAAAIEPSKAL